MRPSPPSTLLEYPVSPPGCCAVLPARDALGCVLCRDKEPFFGSPAPAGQALSIILIIAVLVAVGTTVLIVLAPEEGEKFTEFYILGPKGKAADYPTEFMSGTPQTVIIGIGNQEYQDITYTVETFAVRSRFDEATNQSVIVSATLLDRFSVTVPHNETIEQPYTFRIMDPIQTGSSFSSSGRHLRRPKRSHRCQLPTCTSGWGALTA